MIRARNTAVDGPEGRGRQSGGRRRGAASSRGGCAAQRRARPAVRARGGLSGPQGQPEHDAALRGAHLHREQGGVRAAGVQRLGDELQQRPRDLPEQHRRRHVQLRSRRSCSTSPSPKRARRRRSASADVDFYSRQAARAPPDALAGAAASCSPCWRCVAARSIWCCSRCSARPKPERAGARAARLRGAPSRRGILLHAVRARRHLHLEPLQVPAAALGRGVVARSLGGVRVDADTQDLKRRRLRNVVEEMAIASGVPVPEIYVLEHESAASTRSPQGIRRPMPPSP